MKRLIFAALVFLVATFAQAGDEGWTLKEKAAAAATADGVTTMAFLATKTGIEANPIMPTMLPAVAGVTLAKAMILYSLDETAPLSETVLRFSFAEFTGLAVNNLLVMAHAGAVVAPAVGIATALALWFHETKKKAAKTLALTAAEKGPVALVAGPTSEGEPPVSLAAQ